VLRLPEGPVTAIPANPDGAAEEIGNEFNFATHWKKTRLEPGEDWRPPLLNPDGTRYLDGTLVFYVPLVHRDGRLYGPTLLGLARVHGRKVLAICPIGRVGVGGSPRAPSDCLASRRLRRCSARNRQQAARAEGVPAHPTISLRGRA
jgi:hypothetical protein